MFFSEREKDFEVRKLGTKYKIEGHDMVFGKIREAWKKRVRRHLIKNAGKEDWCAFAKALCGSWNSCREFPYECKCCFDSYFNVHQILQNALEQEQAY